MVLQQGAGAFTLITMQQLLLVLEKKTSDVGDIWTRIFCQYMGQEPSISIDPGGAQRPCSVVFNLRKELTYVGGARDAAPTPAKFVWGVLKVRDPVRRWLRRRRWEAWRMCAGCRRSGWEESAVGAGAGRLGILSYPGGYLICLGFFLRSVAKNISVNCLALFSQFNLLRSQNGLVLAGHGSVNLSFDNCANAAAVRQRGSCSRSRRRESARVGVTR